MDDQKSDKKVLIIYQSIHHGNTAKIAKVIAEQLGADLKKPSEINPIDIDEYDLIGFGSGIYNRKHHISIFDFVQRINPQNNKKAFIFSTASISYKKELHKSLRQELLSKGFCIIDEFICRGFMDYSFIKFFGGINKNRPNNEDLENAKRFAIKIKDSL